ncbi:MauE/DoxX family redox-associated membrane protein [Microbacterium sp. NPDC058342]|uniref:MauE/DoxX family redox-associated membrane protein n=1 Tax=Microbacterium sp. NPDC058342 TaxID=3346454 RepID=UPI00365B4B58
MSWKQAQVNAASALLSAGIALVLILSAVGKLRALENASSALHALRLPRVAPRTIIVALAVVELSVAAGLFLPGALARAAAIAAAALALCFLIVVTRAYLLGSREDCGCFGAGGPPISARLVMRNAALLTATVLLSILAWKGSVPFSALTAPDVAQSLVVLLSGALLAAVLWLSVDPSHVPRTDPVPSEAESMDDNARPHVVLIERRTGIPRDISSAAAWRAQLLIFVKPGCGSCVEVMAELDERIDRLKRVAAPSLIVGAPAGHVPAERDDDRLLLDPADHNARLLGVGERRPVAALMATDGSVVQPLARGRDEILQLFDVLEQAAG